MQDVPQKAGDQRAVNGSARIMQTRGYHNQEQRVCYKKASEAKEHKQATPKRCRGDAYLLQPVQGLLGQLVGSRVLEDSLFKLGPDGFKLLEGGSGSHCEDSAGKLGIGRGERRGPVVFRAVAEVIMAQWRGRYIRIVLRRNAQAQLKVAESTRREVIMSRTRGGIRCPSFGPQH